MTQKQPKNTKLETYPIPKLIVNISIPIMISLLVQSLYNIVDGIFVSRISEAALIATGLTYPMQLLMLAISIGTGIGTNSLLSRSYGAKKFEKVRLTALNGLFLAIISCLFFVLFGIFLTRPFLTLCTQDKELVELGKQYLQICMTFSLGQFILTTGVRLLQATGMTHLGMITQCSGAILNVVLDPILIFGFLGIPAMGIQGAAIATVISQWVAGTIAMLFNLTKNKIIRFSVKGFRPDIKIIKDIYKVGVPSMMVQGIGSLMYVGINQILLLSSASAVAFFTVYYKLRNFMFMSVSGFAQGLIPITGFNYGAKHGKRVVTAIKVTLLVNVIIMFVGIIIFWVIPESLLSLFDASTEMSAIGIPALRIICFSFIPLAISLTLGFAMSGMGNATTNMVSNLLNQLIVILPLAYVFTRYIGISTTWYAFIIAEIIAALYVIWRFRIFYAKHLKDMCILEYSLIEDDTN